MDFSLIREGPNYFELTDGRETIIIWIKPKQNCEKQVFITANFAKENLV